MQACTAGYVLTNVTTPESSQSLEWWYAWPPPSFSLLYALTRGRVCHWLYSLGTDHKENASIVAWLSIVACLSVPIATVVNTCHIAYSMHVTILCFHSCAACKEYLLSCGKTSNHSYPRHSTLWLILNISLYSTAVSTEEQDEQANKRAVSTTQILCLLFAWLMLRLWIWRQYVAPKRR
jgi:hypothetical protein